MNLFSERADSTGATGDRLKEGAAINQSLSSLGNVISGMGVIFLVFFFFLKLGQEINFNELGEWSFRMRLKQLPPTERSDKLSNRKAETVNSSLRADHCV